MANNDGGFKSRKFLAYIATSLLILVAGKVIAAGVIAEVIFGLVSCLGIYSGVNGFATWAASKGNVAFPPAANPTQVNAAVNVQPQVPATPKAPKPPKTPAQPEEEEGS